MNLILVITVASPAVEIRDVIWGKWPRPTFDVISELLEVK